MAAVTQALAQRLMAAQNVPLDSQSSDSNSAARPTAAACSCYTARTSSGYRIVWPAHPAWGSPGEAVRWRRVTERAVNCGPEMQLQMVSSEALDVQVGRDRRRILRWLGGFLQGWLGTRAGRARYSTMSPQPLLVVFTLDESTLAYVRCSLGYSFSGSIEPPLAPQQTSSPVL
jgi:hypothetical protein